MLIAKLTDYAAADSPPLEVVEFGNLDFQPPCSEQYIWAFRGAKRDFKDGLLFWIKSLQAQGWEGRESYFAPYAGSALCEPIGEEDFARLVAEYSGSLRVPLPEFLQDFAGYRSGLRMYREWNDVAAVAELSDSFVAFYWSTSA
jgi:hypothetical protein